mmetsp:Transcript_40361/g.114191  ORF Transcript_40361/g.114191 Transcript_40361/m.114191 type:complete len:440 (-) Transcript_40361:722-2041(-)
MSISRPVNGAGDPDTCQAASPGVLARVVAHVLERAPRLGVELALVRADVGVVVLRDVALAAPALRPDLLQLLLRVEALALEVADRVQHVLLLGHVGVLFVELAHRRLHALLVGGGVVEVVEEVGADTPVRGLVVLDVVFVVRPHPVVVDAVERADVQVACVAVRVGAVLVARGRRVAVPLLRQAVPDAAEVEGAEALRGHREGVVAQVIAADEVAEFRVGVPAAGPPVDGPRARAHAGVVRETGPKTQALRGKLRRRRHLELHPGDPRYCVLPRVLDHHLVVDVPQDPGEVARVHVLPRTPRLLLGAVHVERVDRHRGHSQVFAVVAQEHAPAMVALDQSELLPVLRGWCNRLQRAVRESGDVHAVAGFEGDDLLPRTVVLVVKQLERLHLADRCALRRERPGSIHSEVGPVEDELQGDGVVGAVDLLQELRGSGRAGL